MFYKGFFKRIIPFLLTFAVGLFIASFFVSIAAPNFNWRRGRSHRTHDCKRIKAENEELRRDYYQIKRELQELRRTSPDINDVEVFQSSDWDAPPPPPPSKAPRRPKHDR
jgi:hypothetical protein